MNDSTGEDLKLTSTQFADGGNIPARYSCKGMNINPPLDINGVPSNAKSLTLILHDPDAPKGDFVHWLVWNIVPSTTQIPEGALPIGAVEGTTSFGKAAYGGPCPPSGTHRYVFELYALDTTFDISPTTGRERLAKAMEGHILARAKLTGLFGE